MIHYPRKVARRRLICVLKGIVGVGGQQALLAKAGE
jgi:hypothetical protein